MVDIIVRAKNNHALTAKCLRSIRTTTPSKSYRLILSDDGSDPMIGDTMTDIYVRSRFCHGAVTATNMGLGCALNLFDTQYALLMDSDVSIIAGDRGWLVRMVEGLESSGPETAVVGVTDDIERPDLWFAPHAALFRKAALSQLGPFDEQFNPGMWSSEDYAVRLRISNWRIGMARDVRLVREPEVAFQDGKVELTARNERRFLAKWDETTRITTRTEAATCQQ